MKLNWYRIHFNIDYDKKIRQRLLQTEKNTINSVRFTWKIYIWKIYFSETHSSRAVSVWWKGYFNTFWRFFYQRFFYFFCSVSAYQSQTMVQDYLSLLAISVTRKATVMWYRIEGTHFVNRQKIFSLIFSWEKNYLKE